MNCISPIGLFPNLEMDVISVMKLPLTPNHRRRNKLEEAIRRNDVDELQELIKSGINVNTTLQNKSGYTGLHLAAERGFHRCVEILLDAKADPLCVTINQLTPLQLAISNVQVESAKVLLRSCKLEILGQSDLNLKEVLQMLLSPVRSCTRRRAQDILTLVLTSTPVLETGSVFKQNQLFAICRDFVQLRCLKAWLITGNKFNSYQKKLLRSKFKSSDGVLNNLIDFHRKPQSLMHYCRLSIRRSFNDNCNVLYGVSKVPLPQTLRDYVAIPLDSEELELV